MSRPGITYRDVAKAATILFEQNIRPSIEGVRHLLKTGSNSTINRHLREWRDRHGPPMELEQGLPESLLIAVKGVYEAIKAESNARIDTITMESDKTIKDLKNQLNEVILLKSQLIQHEKSLEETIQISQEEKSALQRSLEEAQKNLVNRCDENSLLQSRIQDKISEMDRLSKQLTHVQSNLEHYRESMRQERESDRRFFEEKITVLEKQRQSQEEQLSEKAQKIAVLTQQLNSLDNDKKSLNQKLENVLEQYHQSEIELQTNEINYRDLKERYVKITEDSKQLAEKINRDQQTMNQLELENERIKAHRSVLEKSLEKAEKMIRNFTDKNLFLMQEKTTLEVQLQQVLRSK